MKLLASLPALVAISLTTALSADPSDKAAPHPNAPTGYAERWRILADLDGDEVEDLLLSEPTVLFGKMGGEWTIYLKKDEKFTPLGTVHAHPRALSLEPDFDRHLRRKEDRYLARIWVYLRSGGGRGSFGYFRVGNDSVDPFRGFEIYPNDSGTTLGQAIYAALLESSPIPFRLQFSRTTEEGEVQWEDAE